MSQTNHAAWLTEFHHPFEIKPTTPGKPGKDEVLVRVRATAMNPVDWLMQYGSYSPCPVPRILGNDVAGEIVELGEEVTLFHVGQRVLGHCTALNTDEDRHGGFQELCVVPVVGCAGIPDEMKFEDACVLPLALSTAALGLFHVDHLGLRLPGATQEESQGKREEKETVLVWGGSSSVGCCAIQLAVAAGYRVVTTSSRRNFGLCREVGASEVFDYSVEGTVGDLMGALKGRKCAGAFDGEFPYLVGRRGVVDADVLIMGPAISTRETQLSLAQVLEQLGGGKLALSWPPTPGLPSTVEATMGKLVPILTYL
jgi:NADPH:quinone reductase-like Zn-dependent oxidoreductase